MRVGNVGMVFDVAARLASSVTHQIGKGSRSSDSLDVKRDIKSRTAQEFSDINLPSNNNVISRLNITFSLQATFDVGSSAFAFSSLPASYALWDSNISLRDLITAI